MDPVVNEEGVVVTEQPKVEPVVTPQPGEKTDSALLLKSLQEEREKRKLLEEENRTLKETPQITEGYSDEGLRLKKEIDNMKLAQARRDEADTLSRIESQFPAVRDKSAEFEQYRTENPGMGIETAAKAFLVEKDLFTAPARKGLEKQLGGGRTPPKEGMSIEDVSDLRNNNYRKYSQMVREGKIKVE